MGGGSNSFQANHACLNSDLNNLWAQNNTPLSWAYFKREDLPVQFGIAEGWTVGDMYQEGVIAATEPNRVTWMSGSINCPGGSQTPDQGGAVLDNNGTPGKYTIVGQRY
jgi:phospholipase C